MLCNTEGMVLHARAAANVSYDEDLNVLVFGVLRLLVFGRDRVSQAIEHPHKALEAVIEDDDEQASCDNG